MKKLYFLAFMALSYLAFPQLIAKYDFNGGVTDGSGNGHDGTAIGCTLTTDRFGAANNACSFNGTSDYIDLGVISLNSMPLTISLWSQRPSTDNAAHCLIGQSMNQIVDNSLNLMLTELINPPFQSVGFDIYGDGVYDTTGASSLQWENWCFTFNGTSSATIYRNGQMIKTGAISGNYQGGGNVYIGTTGWVSDFFYGAIDDVRIWGTAMSAAQADSIYQAEKPACAPFGLSANITDVTCHAAANGMVNVSTTSGATPFSFVWTGGQTANPATGLAGGNYTVVVTDAVGCKDSVAMFVNEPSQLSAVMSATATTCYGGSDGAAEGQVTGGTPPYSYGWPPLNQFGSSISGYSAGTYTFNVTDINGCWISDTISIQQPAGMSLNLAVSSATVCQGEPDTLNVTVTGGASPYWYEWHDFTAGSTDTTLNNSFVIEPVTTGSTVAGVYVYDALGCQTYTSGMFWTNMADSLSGTVIEPNSNPVYPGKAYLFKQKSTHVGLGDTAAVISLAPNGSFYTPNLFWGDYFLKVVADSATYPNSIATYYSNKTYPFQWDSALVIQHHTCMSVNDAGKNVTIIEITPPTGSGTITGNVTTVQGFGQRYNGPGLAPMGAPLKGVDVKLGRNPGGSPAARTTTDTSGNYTFTNVDTGSYKIYVDIPNYGMDSARVVDITTTDSVSVKNDYYVDSAMVHVVPHYYITSSPSICNGDSVFAAGAYQTIAGTYYDSLLTTMGGDSILVTDLTVNMLPNVTASTSADTICTGGSVTLTASGATTYSWTGGVTDGSPFSPTGTDTYTVTGTDNNGCADTAMVTVVVKTCVGINSFSREALSAYPNPSAGILTISAGTVPLSIRVQNLAGEKVMDVAVTGSNTQVDISKLPAGAYFVKVQISKEVAKHLKIVKE